MCCKLCGRRKILSSDLELVLQVIAKFDTHHSYSPIYRHVASADVNLSHVIYAEDENTRENLSLVRLFLVHEYRDARGQPTHYRLHYDMNGDDFIYSKWSSQPQFYSSLSDLLFVFILLVARTINVLGVRLDEGEFACGVHGFCLLPHGILNFFAEDRIGVGRFHRPGLFGGDGGVVIFILLPINWTM